MVLNTQRLCIRPIQKGDWEALLDIWQDAARSPLAQYDVPHDLDPSLARAKTRRWAEIYPGGEHMYFAVCLGGVMIGYIDFHRTPEGYECGCCFHSGYHGKGYARGSMKALITWIADGRQMRFTAGAALKNTPSVRLLNALGFEKTGEEQVTFYQDERGRDIYFTGGIFSLDVNEANG